MRTPLKLARPSNDFVEQALVRKARRAAAPKRRSSPRRGFEQACQEARELSSRYAQSHDEHAFDEASPRVLVGMYALLHTKVYGVSPDDLLDGKAFLGACGMAGKLVRDQFGGSVRRAVEFLRWVWRREKWLEDRNKEGRTSRLGWRLQFGCTGLVVDYRVAVARQARR
jgi:hypothetical protein